MWERKPGIQQGQDKEFAKMANPNYEDLVAKVEAEEIPFSREEYPDLEDLLGEKRFLNNYLSPWENYVLDCMFLKGIGAKQSKNLFEKRYLQSGLRSDYESVYKNLITKLKMCVYYFRHTNELDNAGLTDEEKIAAQHCFVKRLTMSSLKGMPAFKAKKGLEVQRIYSSALRKLKDHYSNLK